MSKKVTSFFKVVDSKDAKAMSLLQRKRQREAEALKNQVRESKQLK